MEGMIAEAKYIIGLSARYFWIKGKVSIDGLELQ